MCGAPRVGRGCEGRQVQFPAWLAAPGNPILRPRPTGPEQVRSVANVAPFRPSPLFLGGGTNRAASGPALSRRWSGRKQGHVQRSARGLDAAEVPGCGLPRARGKMWKDRALAPKAGAPRARDRPRPPAPGPTSPGAEVRGLYTPRNPQTSNRIKETTKPPSCTRPHFYQTRLGPHSVTMEGISSPSDFRSRGRASLGAATRGLQPPREES